MGTALLVVGVIVAVVAAVAIGVVVAARLSAKKGRDDRAAQARETARVMTPDGRLSPVAIKPGDVVALKGVEHLVVGSVQYLEDGFEWREHLLEDAERVWLSVEDEDGVLETVLWRAVRGTGLAPGPNRIEHEGTTFDFEEASRASYRSWGSTGLPAEGQVEYADYRGPGDRRLGFERFSQGTWEVALGTVLGPGDITVWARSGAP